MLSIKNISSLFSSLLRITVLSFFILHAQAQENELNKAISVDYKQKTFEEILTDISDQTGLQFSYSPDNIPINKKLNYTASDKKVIQILSEIFESVEVEYEIIGGHLVLKEKSIAPIVTPSKKTKKKFTISGFVNNSKNKEALIGAAVYNAETGIGALTNNYGYFSLTLPEGTYTLEATYLGYNVSSQEFELNKNQYWNIKLEQATSLLEEVIVSSIDKEKLVFSSHAAQTNIKPIEVVKQTAALGESDMLKSLDNLPGISFQSDGSSYFFVRGGNRDQNLILLDEAPIFNPSHMLGLFTPIIPDAIKTTNVYKADFPIEYGGRLSSVIDIRTKDGNKERFSGSASMGLVATRFSVEGPIIKNKSSYFVSYRRSYFGWIAKNVDPNIQDFFFTDYTTKFNLRLGKKDRLFLTFYNGHDKFITQDIDSTKNGIEWGNTSFTMRWNHLFGNKIFSNTTIYTSRYDYYLHTDLDKNINWNSRITGTHLKTEFTYIPNTNNRIKFGYKVGGYFFNPGNYNAPNIAPENTVSEVNSSEFIIYAGNEYKIKNRLLINYGLRLTNWSNRGEAFVVEYENYVPTGLNHYEKGETYYNYNTLEPRLSLSYKTGIYSSLKLSYNRSTQNINLINNSISPFNSLEVWLPSGPNIKPQWANIYDFGFIKAWPKKTIDFSVDVFYKDLNNQLDYIDHAEIFMNPQLEGQIRQGGGKAYGFELYLKKTQGRLSGQIGYSFTRSFLQIEGINNNKEYRARQDKPIDFSIGGAYFLKPRWMLSFNYIYQSGLATTTPTSFYNYRGTMIPIYTEKNNDRLPNYKRFDVGTDFRLNKRDNSPVEHHLIISFYNFFYNKNAAFLYFNKTPNGDDNFIVPTDKTNINDQVSTYRYIYSIIPSISYNLRF